MPLGALGGAGHGGQLARNTESALRLYTNLLLRPEYVVASALRELDGEERWAGGRGAGAEGEPGCGQLTSQDFYEVQAP